VSLCFPFKRLTHLTDGHEKWHENHAIGVHPNIALLNSSDNSLYFVIINALVQKPCGKSQEYKENTQITNK
jgi:hypothetical protein